MDAAIKVPKRLEPDLWREKTPLLNDQPPSAVQQKRVPNLSLLQKIAPPIMDLSFRKELIEGPAVGEDEDLISTTFVNFQLQCNKNQGVT